MRRVLHPIALLLLVVVPAGCAKDPAHPGPQPVAAFDVGGTLQAGQAATFDASASAGAGALSYGWTFGDGARGGTREIAHLYALPGTYTVELAVRDAAGKEATASRSVTIAAGPAPTGTAALAGRVTTTAGQPLGGVSVTVAGAQGAAQTGADGGVTLPAVPAGVPVVLRLERAGYADQLVPLEALAAGSTGAFFAASLTPRSAPVTLASAAAGGAVAGPGGARVELPAGGLVRADGTAAAGAVEVSVTPVDLVGAIEAFPGAFTGARADGTQTPIATLGVMEVVLSQGGSPLQLAPGHTALLEIPIHTGGAAAGATIPLWSLDERAGVWVQEGTGTVVTAPASPTGLALRARVGHLSWWNVDIPYLPFLPSVRCVTLDGNGNPVSLTVPCWVRAKQESVAAPLASPARVLEPGAPVPLQLFPNVPTRLHGAAQGGMLAGNVLVSGVSGASQAVDIVLTGSVAGPPTVDVVIAGGDGQPTLVVSGQGSPWTARPSPFDGPGSSRVRALSRGGGIWVAGGAGPGGAIATSLDGLSWTAVPAASMFTSVGALFWTGTEFVAAGDGPTGIAVATSFDGETWSGKGVSGVPGSATGVACNTEICLASGTAGALLISQSGSGSLTMDIWMNIPSPFGTGPIHALEWNGSLWVAVGEDDGPRIATSADGEGWLPVPSPLAGARAIAWNGSTWMLGGDGAVATSATGDQWVVHPVPALRVHGVAWSGAQWIAVGESAAGGGVVLTSPDGVAWSAAPLPFPAAGRAVLSKDWPH